MTTMSAIVLSTTLAHADMYSLTFSGILDSAVDTRTADNDPFEGTAWGLDNYSASVGDAWEYTITYDSETIPDDLGDSYAIYSLHYSTSVSLNGNTLELMQNTQLYFIDDEVEIFGEAPDINGDSFVRTVFGRSDGLSDLINGGQLFTDPSDFDGLQWLGFLVGSNQGLFDLDASNATEVTITVDPIPAPSSLLVIGTSGLFIRRRRR